MSNTGLEQKGGRSRMQNGIDQKNQNARPDEFDSNYVHPANVNQPYGMAPTTDSYMPSYYGQMAFPYMGGSEWSTGTDSMPYLSGYGGDAQQPNFVPDAVFNHPPAPLGSTPAYYNHQPYNFFPPGSDFSAWASPSATHAPAVPDNNTGSGFGQHSAPTTLYNGDFYQSIMPATPHDYLGGGEALPSGNSNSMIGHSAPGTAIPNASGLIQTNDSVSKMPVGSSNSLKMVEHGIQNMGLGASSMHNDPMKQQTGSMAMSGSNAGVGQAVNMPGQVGKGVNANNAGSPVLPRSNAPKPVSWAAIASKPAKPQPKPKAKSAVGTGLPPPIKHNMDIGTWDNAQPPAVKGPARGPMPGQQPTMPQRWSAPRQGGASTQGNPDGQTIASNQNHQNNAAGAESPNVPSSKAPTDLDESVNKVLEKLKAENDYNPKRLTLDVRNARFFVIKSYSEDDIHRSIKYNIWCSTEHGNKRLDAAYRAQQGRGPVIFLYSVNGSGHFCGVAEMTSNIDYSKRAGVWSQDKWKGKFQVRWIYAKDVPNNMLRHIRLENNENKPVTNSRDTQEVPAEKGRQVLKIISNYKHTTSIFDDFAHYERREQEEELQRAKRNDQTKNRENHRRGTKNPSAKSEQSDQLS